MMTLFNGMLLFDVAEPSIGKWREQLGWRGTKDEWQTEDGRYSLFIESFEEDIENDVIEEEVWIADNKTGSWDSLFFGEYDEVKEKAKKWMKENPEGWM